MQIKLFTIPTIDGESVSEEMNRFMRGHKILEVEQQLITNANGSAAWCFCLKYIDNSATICSSDFRNRAKVDYKELLSDREFATFSSFRVARKAIAEADSIPAYNVFLDAELAEFVKMEELTINGMRAVKGIGIKKIEKYGERFIKQVEVETISIVDET